MFALPDTGVTVWPVGLILDPPAPPPSTAKQPLQTVILWPARGEPDRWWKLGGGFPLSCRGAFTHLTQHVTQLLGLEMIYICETEISLELATLGFYLFPVVRGRPLQSGSTNLQSQREMIRSSQRPRALIWEPPSAGVSSECSRMAVTPGYY